MLLTPYLSDDIARVSCRHFQYTRFCETRMALGKERKFLPIRFNPPNRKSRYLKVESSFCVGWFAEPTSTGKGGVIRSSGFPPPKRC